MESKIISTELPINYTSWAAALADARKAPEWNNNEPLIACKTHIGGIPLSWTEYCKPPVYYEKAYLVERAAAE